MSEEEFAWPIPHNQEPYFCFPVGLSDVNSIHLTLPQSLSKAQPRHLHTGLFKMSIKGTTLTAVPWDHILMVLCSSSNILILRTWSAFHCFQNRICPPGSTWHCKEKRDKDGIIMKLRSSCQRQPVLQGILFEHSQRQLISAALHNDFPALYFSDQLFVKQKIKNKCIIKTVGILLYPVGHNLNNKSSFEKKNTLTRLLTVVL